MNNKSTFNREAISYTRVSSREQEQEGFSLGAQARTYKDYACKHELQVIRSFEDVETAKSAGRTQFNEMVRFLKKNRSCRIILVEKTDRLYRNLADAVTIENLDVEVHLVKEGIVLSKDSKSQTKFIHGINLMVARNYSDNLREEVKKGMVQKALQGVFPGYAPFGYRNNKGERTIEIDPEDHRITIRIFELYATGTHTLSTIRKAILIETGKKLSRGNIHLILKNRFYIGEFTWRGQIYPGTHPLFLSPHLFDRAQDVLTGKNRPKYSKREIALRGLMTCSHDGCALTGEIQKEKYVYYRCTGHRGKCELPRFREDDLLQRLGEPLKHLQVPEEIVRKIVDAIERDDKGANNRVALERSRLQARLTSLHKRMGDAYNDKLDGKIPEEFWQRQMSDWNAEDARLKAAIGSLNQPVEGSALNAQKILELAQSAYFLYLNQDPKSKADLLKSIVSNCSVDAVSIRFEYKKPFDLIAHRGEIGKWSGRLDSN